MKRQKLFRYAVLIAVTVMLCIVLAASALAAAAPEEYKLSGNKVTGLKAAANYKYRYVGVGSINANTMAVTVNKTAGGSDILDKNTVMAGLFQIGEAIDGASSYTWYDTLYYAPGANVKNVIDASGITVKSLTWTAMNKLKYAATLGSWVGYYLDNSFGGLVLGNGTSFPAKQGSLGLLNSASNREEFLTKHAYWYAYNPDEIIPMDKFESFKYFIEKVSGDINVTGGNLKTEFSFVVILPDGTGTVKTVEFPASFNGGVYKVSLNDFTDAGIIVEGYIAGIIIKPFSFENVTAHTFSGTDLKLATVLYKDSYKIKSVIPQAPSDLVVSENVLCGFDKELQYEYAQLEQQSDGSMSLSEAYPLTETTSLSGLVKVRASTDGDVWSDWSRVYYISGGRTDDILHYTTESGKDILEFVSLSPGYLGNTVPYITGKWTGLTIDKRLMLNYGFPNLYLGGLGLYKIADQKQLNSISFTYKYCADEIIPLDDFIEMRFRVAIRQTPIIIESGTLKTLFTFTVVGANGGVTEKTVVKNNTAIIVSGVTTTGSTDHTVTLQDFVDAGYDTTGYITAIRITPYYDDGSVVIDYSNYAAHGSDLNVQLYHDGYVVKKTAVAPTLSVSQNIVAGYDVTITNYDSVADYRYSSDGGVTWTAIPSGTQKFTVPSVGTYTVELSGETIKGTACTNIEVVKLTPTLPSVTSRPIAPNSFEVILEDAIPANTYEYRLFGEIDWVGIADNSFILDGNRGYDCEIRVSGDYVDGYEIMEFTPEKATPTYPVLSCIPTDSGYTVNVNNYSNLYNYMYRIKGGNWITLTSHSFTVSTAGTYTVRASGNVYSYATSTQIEVKDYPDALKALTVSGAVLSGFDTSKSYEYASVGVDGVGTYSAIDNTEAFTLGEGLWSVRTTDNTMAKIFHVRGTDSDRKFLGETVTKTSGSTTYTAINTSNVLYYDKWIEGVWTGKGTLTHSSYEEGMLSNIGIDISHAELNSALASGDKSAEYIARNNIVSEAEALSYAYALTKAELLSVKDFKQFGFSLGKRQGDILLGNVDLDVVFTVINPDASISYHTWSVGWRSDTNRYSFNIVKNQNYWDVPLPSEGWIARIEIKPYQNVKAENITSSRYGTNTAMYIILKEGNNFIVNSDLENCQHTVTRNFVNGEYFAENRTCSHAFLFFSACEDCGAKTDKIFTYGETLDHNYNEEKICTVCGVKMATGLTYTLINGGKEYEVTGIGTCNDKRLEIPSEYNGKPVTSIGVSAFANQSQLKSVIIPDTVTRILNLAFYNNFYIESINIPASVTEVGPYAFYGCKPVKTINGIAYLDNWALTVYSCGSNVIIEEGTVGIARNLFAGRSVIQSVTIPDGLKYISNNAFYNCANLTAVNIPSSVVSIGQMAFTNSMNAVDIIDGIYYVDNWVVGSTAEVINADILEGTLGVSRDAFSSSHMESITIPSTLKFINYDAFPFGDKLESIKVAEGNSVYRTEGKCLIEIETNTVIRGCNNAVIPEGVTKIADYAFYGNKFDKIVIPDTVTSIEYGAFWATYNEILIPESVTFIADNAVYGKVLCYENSYAHSYAVEHECEYEIIVKEPFKVIGTSLMLDSQIGIKIYFDIDETLVDISSVRFSATKTNTDYKTVSSSLAYKALYKVAGYSTTIHSETWMTALTYDIEKDLYYIILSVAPKDADNVSFTSGIKYILKDGTKVDYGAVDADLNISSYIDDAKALAGEGKEEFVKALDLVEKIEDYASYADNYFNNKDLEEQTAVIDPEEIPTAQRTQTPVGTVEFVSTSLLLDESITIRHYFEPDSLDGYAERYQSNIEYGTKGSLVYYDIKNITPENIGTLYNLTIKDADGNTVVSLDYSVANYIASVIGSQNKRLVSLMSTMYNYYIAAKNYLR